MVCGFGEVLLFLLDVCVLLLLLLVVLIIEVYLFYGCVFDVWLFGNCFVLWWMMLIILWWWWGLCLILCLVRFGCGVRWRMCWWLVIVIIFWWVMMVCCLWMLGLCMVLFWCVVDLRKRSCYFLLYCCSCVVVELGVYYCSVLLMMCVSGVCIGCFLKCVEVILLKVFIVSLVLLWWVSVVSIIIFLLVFGLMWLYLYVSLIKGRWCFRWGCGKKCCLKNNKCVCYFCEIVW